MSAQHPLPGRDLPPPGHPATDVRDAIASRRSVRAFLDKPVARQTIEDILALATRAPSGSNIQPWKVTVLSGDAKRRLVKRLMAARAAGATPNNEYNYYPVAWREPYIGRRRATGWGLYGLLGIKREDKDKMAAQHDRNFVFFDAPVGLIFTIDRDMEQGSWLDYGMFLQSIMVAARGYGLDTCPQAAFCGYHDIIEDELSIPDTQMLVCGMSLGYADPEAPVNTFWTERESINDFTEFRE